LEFAQCRLFYIVLQCSSPMASEQKRCSNPFLSWHRNSFFLSPFQFYDGEMLHRLLVFLTGTSFIISRSRTSSGNQLMPGLFFFCEKIWSAPPFYLSADCELPTDSKPERELVTLNTVVGVPIYKMFTVARSMRK